MGDGWQITGYPVSGVGLDLALADDDTSTLAMTRFDGNVFAGSCRSEENREGFLEVSTPTTFSAQGLMDHLTAHPHLSGEVSQTELAGSPAIQLDADVNVGPECYSIAYLWPVAHWYHATRDGYRIRVIARDDDDAVFVVYVEAKADDFPVLLEQATPLIDSMEFPSSEGT